MSATMSIFILLWFPMTTTLGFEAGHISAVYRSAEACDKAKIEMQKRRPYEIKGDAAYSIDWYCSEFNVK